MKPSNKSEGMEQDIKRMFGHDRRACIEANVCVPAPVGCGGPATEFNDELSRKEYSISGLCQNCQDSVFGKPKGKGGTKRYVAGPDEFVTDEYSMFSGQAEAVARLYNKYVGKSGNTWLVAQQEQAAEEVYVTNNPANSGGEGFGGATLSMPLVEGGVFLLRGGWHTNADSLFKDTGVDVRNTHRTFVVLSKERDSTNDGSWRTVMRGIVYKDSEPVLGSFDRYKELIKQHPEAKFYYSKSKGGSSLGPV